MFPAYWYPSMRFLVWWVTPWVWRFLRIIFLKSGPVFCVLLAICLGNVPNSRQEAGAYDERQFVIRRLRKRWERPPIPKCSESPVARGLESQHGIFTMCRDRKLSFSPLLWKLWKFWCRNLETVWAPSRPCWVHGLRKSPRIRLISVERGSRNISFHLKLYLITKFPQFIPVSWTRL